MTANGSFDTTHIAPWTPQWLMGQHINNTDTTLSGGVVPADMGFLAYNFDPTLGVTTSTPLTTAGTVYVMKLHTNVDITVTNIVMYVTTANGTPTTGQNFAGLFTSGKALMAATADQSTAWGSTGYVTMALSAAQQVPAGYFYVGVFSNGTTQPAFMKAGHTSGNGVLTTANSRWASADATRTTTFPAILGTFTATTNAYWAAVN